VAVRASSRRSCGAPTPASPRRTSPPSPPPGLPPARATALRERHVCAGSGETAAVGALWDAGQPGEPSRPADPLPLLAPRGHRRDLVDVVRAALPDPQLHRCLRQHQTSAARSPTAAVAPSRSQASRQGPASCCPAQPFLLPGTGSPPARGGTLARHPANLQQGRRGSWLIELQTPEVADWAYHSASYIIKAVATMLLSLPPPSFAWASLTGSSSGRLVSPRSGG
jgi:hypothetical protein